MQRNDSRHGGLRRMLIGLTAMLLALALTAPAAAQVAAPTAPAIASPASNVDSGAAATAWLLTRQLENGAFPGLSGTADVGVTTDAALALSAAAHEGIDVKTELAGALAYLYANGGEYAKKGAGQAAKLVLAVEAAHGDAAKVTGGDPVALVRTALAGENGLYSSGAFDHAYVMLAMAATGGTVPPSAVDALARTQIADGSWGFDGKPTAGNGDTNTTAMVIQALTAAGQRTNPIVAKAIAYLKSTQAAGGSFPYQGGAAGDANSTALVIQAFIAAGQKPDSAAGTVMLAALKAFQNPDGAFRYQAAPPDDNLFSTVQAIPAILAVDFGNLMGVEVKATPAAETRSWELGVGS